MYLPNHFAQTDTAQLHALIRAYPLANLVTLNMPSNDPNTSHHPSINANLIPFYLDTNQGKNGVLRAHVARANPICKNVDDNVDALVIFQSVDAYISPSFYPSKQQHSKVVPTWNYATVQASGKMRIVDDRAWLLDLVTLLTQTHEQNYPDKTGTPWQVTDAPADYIEQMLNAIIGIEIEITELVGKWKVSQNRSAEDRAGVKAGLENRGLIEAAKLIS